MSSISASSGSNSPFQLAGLQSPKQKGAVGFGEQDGGQSAAIGQQFGGQSAAISGQQFEAAVSIEINFASYESQSSGASSLGGVQGLQSSDGGGGGSQISIDELLEKLGQLGNDLVGAFQQIFQQLGEQSQQLQQGFANLVGGILEQAGGGQGGNSGQGFGFGIPLGQLGGGSNSALDGLSALSGSSGLGGLAGANGGQGGLSITETAAQFQASFEGIQAQLGDGQSVSAQALHVQFQLNFSQIQFSAGGGDPSNFNSAFDQARQNLGGNALNAVA